MHELVDAIYGQGNTTSVERIHPHRLAAFLAVLAIGTQRSVEFSTPAGLNLNAERYYVLTCAALSLAPIITEAMCATVQAMFLINCYLVSNTRKACEESWLTIGLMARLAVRVRRASVSS